MTLAAHYDIIIVGSGVGGGALAHRLASPDKKILMLERGVRLPKEADNWSVDAVFKDKKYVSGETWRDGDGNEFEPGIYYYVGGNSKFFGAATVRFREQDFKEFACKGGTSPGWPISYADLDSYYDRAEAMMGTHGERGDDPLEPPRKTSFPYPAMGHEPVIQRMADKLRAKGLRPFRLPMAVDYQKDGNCVRCSTCDGFPCKVGAKGDAERSFIDPALAKGGITLVTGAMVHRILTNSAGNRATHVEVTIDGELRKIEGDLIVSSCGAINSAALMLRSANDQHKRGLGNNESDLVGRNYMAHNNTIIMALSPFEINRTSFQKTLGLNDYYFANAEKPYPLGHIQGVGRLRPGMLAAEVPLPKWFLSKITDHSVDWLAMSEDLPDPENRVLVDNDGTIRLAYRANNLESHGELVRIWKRHLRACGYPVAISRKLGIEVSLHQCGTMRFGTDAKTSVLTPHNRVWDVENLYVVDASFLPSSTSLNPSLTIAAQALRVGDHLAGLGH